MEKNSIRITLRIPEQLHEKLTDSANDGTRSLNSEILKRLEDSYCQEESTASLTAKDVRYISDLVIRERLDHMKYQDEYFQCMLTQLLLEKLKSLDSDELKCLAMQVKNSTRDETNPTCTLQPKASECDTDS